MKWKDVTSYRRGDGNEPRTWELRNGGIRVVVSRWAFGEPDRWYLTCHDTKIINHELYDRDLVPARNEALRIVKAKIDAMARSVAEMCEAVDA